MTTVTLSAKKLDLYQKLRGKKGFSSSPEQAQATVEQKQSKPKPSQPSPVVSEVKSPMTRKSSIISLGAMSVPNESCIEEESKGDQR